MHAPSGLTYGCKKTLICVFHRMTWLRMVHKLPSVGWLVEKLDGPICARFEEEQGALFLVRGEGS